MKALLYIILPFILCLFSSPQKEQPNVTVILHLDEELAQTEQMIYITSFCSWVSGFEQNIWDSVQTKKGQRLIKLRAYTPTDENFNVIFSKEGPDRLIICALPKDTVEIEVAHTDVSRGAIYKEAIKGKIHNKCVKYSNTSRDYWLKKHLLEAENNTDSIKYWDQKMIEFYRESINNAKYAMNATISITILRTHFKDHLPADTIQAIREQVAKRFPNDPSTVLDYGYNKTQTENGIRVEQRIKEINRAKSNYKKFKQKTRIGNTIDLNLNGIDGTKIALSDLKSCQYIYVDIWASWCKPCRIQFPNVKKALNKYPQALKIYAVSIDKNHNAWKEAIKKDSLQSFIHVIGTNDRWEQLKEVSDLGVERIPRSFLLDSNRRIIAKDLHENELIEALDSLYRK